MLSAKTIIDRAGTLLLDEDYVRWTVPELAGWIEEGISTIVLVKPSASSGALQLDLVSGTRQSLPDDEHVLLILDIPRNVNRVSHAPGRAVKPVSRDSLDATQPDWHDGTKVPFKSAVRHFVYDEAIPRLFYVYPGNDGTGSVEAHVSILPPAISTLIAGGADVGLPATWDVDVGIGEEYQSALLDYVMYRAFSKEEPAAAPGRSNAFYQSFATALGIKTQVEAAQAPRANRSK
jgi:hypothetical protein